MALPTPPAPTRRMRMTSGVLFSGFPQRVSLRYAVLSSETLVLSPIACDNRRMNVESTPASTGLPGGHRGVEGTYVDKGLKGGAIGLLSSVVIGMSSTAPAYSLAATLGFVVIAVGVKAPAMMLLAFIPMYLIAVAYSELNKREPDCGTTFTWAARAFGPRTGWLGGWGIIAADIIVMANLAQIAGSYGFLLFGLDGLAESTFWTTVAGVLWIVVMTWVCYIGLEVSKRVQYVLLSIELVTLLAFAVYALVHVYNG